MSKATPTPAPTAGHEMRRSTWYIYSNGCSRLSYAKHACPPHAAVCLLTLPDTLLRGVSPVPLLCPSPPGIGGLGLSKEETRIVHANTMHSHRSKLCAIRIHPFIGSQGAAWLVQLPGTSRSSLKMRHTANSSLDMREYALLSSTGYDICTCSVGEEAWLQCLDIRRWHRADTQLGKGVKKGKMHVAREKGARV